jgi:hypothetical protein
MFSTNSVPPRVILTFPVLTVVSSIPVPFWASNGSTPSCN